MYIAEYSSVFEVLCILGCFGKWCLQNRHLLFSKISEVITLDN